MPQLQGINRNQLQMLSLNELISEDHVVRLIEAFVDYLDLDEMGFVEKGKIKDGRPAYRREMLLKLYLYGYLNQIRSSRRLERECRRNVELWWLLGQQVPGYKTIANFRKDHSKALRNVFRQYNLLCREWGLFEGKTVAIDGSKFRAQNSKKMNFNARKIKRHLDYIDKKLGEYFEALNAMDEEEKKGESGQVLELKQDQLHERRQRYEQLKEQLEEAERDGDLQISLSDPDARALPLHMGIVEIGYNVQTAVDASNKMVLDYEVTNENDTYALSSLALRSKELLEVEQLDILADKGYHTGSEMKACAAKNIRTFISPKDTSVRSKAKAYRKDQFHYDTKTDTYTCPEFQTLSSNGRWYKKNEGKGRQPYRVKVYKLPFQVCKACPVKLECAGVGNLKNSKGRPIERSEYDDYLLANRKRVEENKDYYRQRQSIVEHPFGTIKRQWGYRYTLLKTKRKVDGEFALIFLSYNLRRAMSTLGVLEMIKWLKELKSGVLGLRRIRECSGRDEFFVVCEAGCNKRLVA